MRGPTVAVRLVAWYSRENGARLTPTETVRLIRDGEKVGGGGGGGGVWMLGRGILIPIATLSPPECCWLVGYSVKNGSQANAHIIHKAY